MIPSLYHFHSQIRRHNLSHKTLYLVSAMILFYSLFDGIISYVTPLILTQAGFSESTMGLIISSSSVAGMIFDFIICRVFKNANFRKIFFVVFILCGLYPLILGSAQSVWIFVIAMALWGIYFDLGNFGGLNFLSNYIVKREHTSSSGVMQVFKSLGYILAPILAGLTIGEAVGWEPFILAWIFLIISFVFFLSITILEVTKTKKHPVQKVQPTVPALSIFQEMHLWARTITLLRRVFI